MVKDKTTSGIAVLAAVMMLVVMPSTLGAQQASLAGAGNPRVGLGAGVAIAVAARATTGAPKIDGHLDDEVWQLATPISDFTQREPDEGQPASERTEASILFTDDAIFIGVRASDSQAESIRGQLTRRDVDSPSDWIGVALDSYYDRRTAFVFLVNAAGVKRDSYYFDDYNQDNSWDAVWEVKVSRDSEGWSAEFRIPLSQLRFGKGQDTWGFNVYRRVDRLNEEQYWRVPPKSESGMVSRFGDLVGLQSLEPPRRAEFLPYVAGTGDFYDGTPNDPFNTGHDRTGRVGADLNLGLTSNFTLSATINPDFGQVEADPAVVNLSAFETFFPEKRPFFLEGVDIYQFPIGLGDGDGSAESLFYTRRVGRAPQGRADARGGYAESVDQTTILGSAKLSGKTSSGWTIGALASMTAEEKASVFDSMGTTFQDVVEPRTSYLVGTVKRDFREGQTQLGLFGTAMNRSLPENLQWMRDRAFTGGASFGHRFANQSYSLDAWVAGSQVNGSETSIDITQRSSARYYQRPDNTHVTYDPTRTSLTGYAANASLGKIAGNWRFSTGVDTRSPGFESNDMGFQRDADRTITWVWANRRWLQPGKVFRRFNVNFNGWSGWTYGGERVAAGGNINTNWTFKNWWNGFLGTGYDLSTLSAGTLRGGPAFQRPASGQVFGGISSDSRKTFRFGVNAYYGPQEQEAGWSYHIATNVSWRPATNLDFTVAPSVFRQRNGWQYFKYSGALNDDHFVFGELEQTVTSMTLRANMTFTPGMSLQVYAEPFVAVGNYTRFKEVANPRGATFQDRFTAYEDDQMIDLGDGELGVDLDRDGTSNIYLGNPDFTALSFRSNVVLRWEYMLGSTLFLVWQHNRSDSNSNYRYNLGTHIGDIFDAPARNTFVIKVNYWLSM